MISDSYTSNNIHINQKLYSYDNLKKKLWLIQYITSSKLKFCFAKILKNYTINRQMSLAIPIH